MRSPKGTISSPVHPHPQLYQRCLRFARLSAGFRTNVGQLTCCSLFKPPPKNLPSSSSISSSTSGASVLSVGALMAGVDRLTWGIFNLFLFLTNSRSFAFAFPVTLSRLLGRGSRVIRSSVSLQQFWESACSESLLMTGLTWCGGIWEFTFVTSTRG